MDYLFNTGFVIILIIILFILLIYLAIKANEERRREAGRHGEFVAFERLEPLLTKTDCVLRNIDIEVNGRKTEFDCIIVNHNGVFIIEVKNYSGIIYGELEDKQWTKSKTTDAGNVYSKIIDNPIYQVKREVYLLSQFLKANKIRIWVTGFVYMVNENAPTENEFLYNDIGEVASRIHTRSSEQLTSQQIAKVCEVLQRTR